MVEPGPIAAGIEAERNMASQRDQLQDALLRDLEAADPENRLVTSELEARWNKALARVGEIEAKIAKHRTVTPQPLPMSASQATALAGNLRTVWTAPTTDARLKKRIVETGPNLYLHRPAHFSREKFFTNIETPASTSPWTRHSWPIRIGRCVGDLKSSAGFTTALPPTSLIIGATSLIRVIFRSTNCCRISWCEKIVQVRIFRSEASMPAAAVESSPCRRPSSGAVSTQAGGWSRYDSSPSPAKCQ